MPQSPRARFLLLSVSACLLAASLRLVAAPQLATQQPPAQQAPAQQAPQTKPQPVGPPAVQSTHYPILLLAQGSMPNPQQKPTDVQASPTDSAQPATPDSAQPTPGSIQPVVPSSTQPAIPVLTWSLRIGQKGPERLDRTGYPPIPLEPADVVREGTTDAWTYHAKDAQTGAAVSVHLTREPCVDAASATKFVFTASVEHAQIGAMQGCARVAAELFPRINNQLSDDDDDAKEKPIPPTITHFKPPVAIAYIAATDKMVVKRGKLAKSVPGKAGYSLCLSHDGKKLLFTRDELPAPLRTINEYDFETGRTKELLRANAYAPFWSPDDDSRIAFLQDVNGQWQVWTMTVDAPEKAAAFYPGAMLNLHGWVDAHTILAEDSQKLSWIGDDGAVKQTVAGTDLYGKDQFTLSGANSVRIHPLNPDLLLVSAELLTAPAAAASKDAPKGSATPPGQAFFLYEIGSKRRVVLSPPGMSAEQAEWSKDGLQVFFTGRDSSASATTIYKMFWDGTSQLKVVGGKNYVIGQ